MSDFSFIPLLLMRALSFRLVTGGRYLKLHLRLRGDNVFQDKLSAPFILMDAKSTTETRTLSSKTAVKNFVWGVIKSFTWDLAPMTVQSE
jgi:hypothetical protein